MMDCPVCSANTIKTKYALKNGHSVLLCKQCSTEFLFPQLTDEALQQLYAESYYAAWGLKGNTDNDATRQMKLATFELYLKLLKRLGKQGRLLDVGCATGYLLEAARFCGWAPYGVEYAAWSAAIAQQKFGHQAIFNGTLEQCIFEENFFDVIVMSDLIEHVRSPQETLQKARRLLKDDGLLLIVTPDTAALSHHLMGKRWTHYKLEHFFYFNRRSFQHLAKKSGWEIMHYEKAAKALNLGYFHTQFNVYPHWLLTPMANTLHALLPQKAERRNFYLSIGEMVLILKKKETM
ncbi:MULTISPECIES: class I SAM-dependent methyltransferase [Niastella]|uniref:Class I SAM-dependent methyltransferase n=1 Tax=Niastella soli TaxID=2821487 RepID=A0ABS3Z011_9BACT|nr:class I SAM-dependent methyltransferase [Niastella soli]MBO9203511.1 class I SAM-dependent methyltransferase [Niastella soli]